MMPRGGNEPVMLTWRGSAQQVSLQRRDFIAGVVISRPDSVRAALQRSASVVASLIPRVLSAVDFGSSSQRGDTLDTQGNFPSCDPGGTSTSPTTVPP